LESGAILPELAPLLLELLRFADSCFLSMPGEDDLLEVGDVFVEGDNDDLAADADDTARGALFTPFFPTAVAPAVASLLALQPIHFFSTCRAW
jgi:hypothetical protein